MIVLHLLGCAELEPYLPVVHFDRLELQHVSFEDVATDFVFQIENPNPVGVDIASFSYALDLEAIEFLSGDNEEGLALPARGSTDLRLPVSLIFANVYDTIQATRGEDIVDFGLAGKFGFDTPLGPVQIPYDEAGGFPALRTPKFQLGKLSVDAVDLFGADLSLDLNVDNDHESTLFFQQLAAVVTLNGESLVDGLLADFDVGGASTGTVSVPIHVDFLSAGLTLVNVIVDGGKVDVGFVASMDVDTPFGVVPLVVDEEALLDLVL